MSPRTDTTDNRPPAEPARGLSLLHRVALAAEACAARARGQLGTATGRANGLLSCEVYRALGHETGINVFGRVLVAKNWRTPRADDSRFANVRSFFQLWRTREVGGVPVRITLENCTCSVTSDDEGYFQADLPLPPEVESALTVRVSLPGDPRSSAKDIPVLQPGASSGCLVISDVDDTILVSRTTDYWSMLSTAFFGNTLTRKIHPATAELYQALSEGPGALRQDNMIAYVTSSPWNLHSVIRLAFERLGLPDGPFFMTDWGVDREKWFKTSHRMHKTRAIERLLEWYPGKPVVLLGDSGQEDAAIYAELALRFPDRIDTILIRNLTGDATAGVAIEELTSAGLDPSIAVYCYRDASEAAAHLRLGGWIATDQADRIHHIHAEANAKAKERLPPALAAV